MSEAIRQKLAAEIDLVPWSALMRHFAFGRVYQVRAPWDLLDAALALHADAKESVQQALQQKLLVQPSAQDVQAWLESKASFEMLVVQPFVLIQAQAERSCPEPRSGRS